MRIRLLYFAAVRDLTRLDEEWVELPGEVKTVRDLGPWLALRYPDLAAHVAAVRFARNEAFSTADEVFEEGDVVAVIPPVAGG